MNISSLMQLEFDKRANKEKADATKLDMEKILALKNKEKANQRNTASSVTASGTSEGTSKALK